MLGILAFMMAFDTFANMRMRAIFLSLLFVVFCTSLAGQERQLGTWKVFQPYSSSTGIVDAGDRVYSAASKNVFSYHKTTGEIQIYDKTNGLSDVDVKTIAYSEADKALAIAYSNSNLDFVFNGTEAYNIPDFKNENASGALLINGFSFHNGSCYVATDIGISVINLAKKEISNTYIIGSTGQQIKVYATATGNGQLFAATQEGVKYAPLNTPNLQNFNAWTLFNSNSGLPAKRAKHVAFHNSKFYAVIEGGVGSQKTDTLYVLNNGTWNSIYFDTLHTITSLYEHKGTLYFSVWNDNNTSQGKIGTIDASGNLSINNTPIARPMGWFNDGGYDWLADAWSGLNRINTQNYRETIKPDGPYTSAVRDLEVSGGKLYVATGGADESWGPAFTGDGFFVYDGERWENRNQFTDAILETVPGLLSIAPVDVRQKVYAGSFLYGLTEWNTADNSFTVYNKDNSILEATQGAPNDTRISTLTVDKKNTLWIGNAGATKPIKALKQTGTWLEYSLPFSFALPKKIVADDNNQLWMPVRGNGEGIVVWNHNGTLENTADDKSVRLGTGAGNGNLPDAIVYCMAEDKEGNMWVGTAQGIAVYYCPGSVTTSNRCDADLIKVERDGYIGFLFGTESVRAIAVDAANRKWVGTTSGVWLISDDGKTELLKFNSDNSPMPANQVTDIAINDETGEVFIGTTGGIVSYQGDAIGECRDCDDALVYPNPVKPDYDGPIAVKGLVEDAYVKITDATGQLVHQGKANGSQMIWNGKNYKGERAASGVYFVYSSTDLGKERRVARILLVN